MVRVRNETEFLYPAVKATADAVDEIVLVGNLSSDAGPAIIERLCRKIGPWTLKQGIRPDHLPYQRTTAKDRQRVEYPGPITSS